VPSYSANKVTYEQKPHSGAYNLDATDTGLKKLTGAER
jgi:hypothetical protein